MPLHPRHLPLLLLLALLAPAACTTPAPIQPADTFPSTPAPDPWPAALAARPLPTRAYHPTFNTLAHHLLDLDSQVSPQPDSQYQFLDSLLADARATIPFNPAETNPAKLRQSAIAALQAMDQLVLQHNIIYPPKGNINTFHEGLLPHQLTAEDQKFALTTNPPGLAPYLAAHASETFRYMDCDILCFLYISIGQSIGLPLQLVACPDHAFVRFNLPDGTHLNWETTLKQEQTDDHYIKQFHLTNWNQHDRAFMVDMTPSEILGYYLCCRAIWQENMPRPRYQAACTDYEKSLVLYPECSLARNNLAWLYLSVPNLSKRTEEEVLQLALGALAIVPTDFQVQDTLACAYAQLGDFPKALAFERIAILGAESDPATTPVVSNELHERLTIFQAGKTYLEALADGSITPVTPQARRGQP